jgi:YfiH family protein
MLKQLKMAIKRKTKMTFYPFTLEFDGLCVRFPFIYEGNPVASPACFISSRAAGDMVFHGAISDARKAFFDSQNINAEKVYSLMQVHSKNVFSVGESGNGPIGWREDSALPASLPEPSAFAREGDGMISFTPRIFLAVTVADCLPVFLLDTENGYWAVLHSGWKGTGIVANAVEMMKQAGTKPENIAAVLGPCIQDCCYRVDEERAKQFEAEFGSIQINDDKAFPLGKVSRYEDGGWYIGLQAANARLLAAAGVRHIAYCTDCTFTDERLGSYRRQGPQTYTRMIAMAGQW